MVCYSMIRVPNTPLQYEPIGHNEHGDVELTVEPNEPNEHVHDDTVELPINDVRPVTHAIAVELFTGQ